MTNDSAAIAKEHLYDAVIDCVDGCEVEEGAFRSLKNTGVFVTVVGPTQYIGESKLSWLAFLKLLTLIACRMFATRITTGPGYTFSVKYPRVVIRSALGQLLKYGIRMPLPHTIGFNVSEIADAVRQLQTHRTRGRIVIDFEQQ